MACESRDGFICWKMLYQHSVFRIMGGNVDRACVLLNMYIFIK